MRLELGVIEGALGDFEISELLAELIFKSFWVLLQHVFLYTGKVEEILLLFTECWLTKVNLDYLAWYPPSS